MLKPLHWAYLIQSPDHWFQWSYKSLRSEKSILRQINFWDHWKITVILLTVKWSYMFSNFIFLFAFFSFFALISWSVVKYSTVLNVLLTWQLNITADHCRDLKSSCFTWSMVIFLSTYQPNSYIIVVIIRGSMQYEKYLPLGNNRVKYLPISRKKTCHNYFMVKCWHKLSALLINLFSNVL